jgi:hypothetical protein
MVLRAELAEVSEQVTMIAHRHMAVCGHCTALFAWKIQILENGPVVGEFAAAHRVLDAIAAELRRQMRPAKSGAMDSPSVRCLDGRVVHLQVVVR